MRPFRGISSSPRCATYFGVVLALETRRMKGSSHARIASQLAENCCWNGGDSGDCAMDVRCLPASAADALTECPEQSEFPRGPEWPPTYESGQGCAELN